MVISFPPESYLFGAGIRQDPSFPDHTAPIRYKQPEEDRVAMQNDAGGNDRDIDNPAWLFMSPFGAHSEFKGSPINAGCCDSWLG